MSQPTTSSANLAAEQPARRQAEFRVSITLEVKDLESLWSAAAEVIAATGASMSEVCDTIGSIDDPDAADCIATLLAPRPIPGVELDDFWIDRIQAAPRADVDQDGGTGQSAASGRDRRFRLPLMTQSASSLINAD